MYESTWLRGLLVGYDQGGGIVRKLAWKRAMVYTFITLITLFATRHLMVLLHEWTHSSIAWILGHKERPFAIHYGTWTLLEVDEAVDYAVLYTAGEGGTAALIAVSALLVNLALFLFCLRLLSMVKIQQQRWLYQLIFWFAVMNIGELFSYIPVRTFVGNRGDVGHLIHGVGISPWSVFLPGSLVIGGGLWYLLKGELENFYQIMSLSVGMPRRIYLGLTLFVIFFWYGASAFHDYGPTSVRSLASLGAALVGIILFFILGR
jgi:hypothetical protein